MVETSDRPGWTRWRSERLISWLLFLTDASPVGVSPVGPAPSGLLTRQLQDGWRTLRGLGGSSPGLGVRRPADGLLFEVTDASVVQDGAAKYVVSSSSERRPDPMTRPDASHDVSPTDPTEPVLSRSSTPSMSSSLEAATRCPLSSPAATPTSSGSTPR